jgi:hypothetical protein
MPWCRRSFPSMPCGRFCPGSRPNDSITTRCHPRRLAVAGEAWSDGEIAEAQDSSIDIIAGTRQQLVTMRP